MLAGGHFTSIPTSRTHQLLLNPTRGGIIVRAASVSERFRLSRSLTLAALTTLPLVKLSKSPNMIRATGAALSVRATAGLLIHRGAAHVPRHSRQGRGNLPRA